MCRVHLQEHCVYTYESMWKLAEKQITGNTGQFLQYWALTEVICRGGREVPKLLLVL